MAGKVGRGARPRPIRGMWAAALPGESGTSRTRHRGAICQSRLLLATCAHRARRARAPTARRVTGLSQGRSGSIFPESPGSLQIPSDARRLPRPSARAPVRSNVTSSPSTPPGPTRPFTSVEVTAFRRQPCAACSLRTSCSLSPDILPPSIFSRISTTLCKPCHGRYRLAAPSSRYVGDPVGGPQASRVRVLELDPLDGGQRGGVLVALGLGLPRRQTLDRSKTGPAAKCWA